MNKVLHTALLLLFLSNVAIAQPERRFERVHAIKVAYITDKMHLSGEESAKFWPVYNRFDEEKRELRKNFFQKARKAGNLTDDDKAMRYVDDDLDYQSEELALRRKYKEKFLKVLSPQQLASLYQAEREFKIMLLQQLNNKGHLRE